MYRAGKGDDELWSSNPFSWDQVYYAVQRNVYYEGGVMETWINEVWRSEVGGLPILVLDSLNVHKMDANLAARRNERHTRV